MNACVLIISQKLIDSRSFPQRRWFPADLRWVMWRITQRWQETSSSTASGLVSKSRCQTGSLKEVQICLFLCLFSKNLNSTSILCPQGSFLGKVRYLFLIILSVFERTLLLYSGLFKYPPHPPPLNFFSHYVSLQPGSGSEMDWNGRGGEYLWFYVMNLYKQTPKLNISQSAINPLLNKYNLLYSA